MVNVLNFKDKLKKKLTFCKLFAFRAFLSIILIATWKIISIAFYSKENYHINYFICFFSKSILKLSYTNEIDTLKNNIVE